MKERLADLRLYRLRYVIGLSVIFVILVAILIIAALYVPGGLRQAEIDTAVATGQLSFQNLSPETIVNLPYHLLQRLSFKIFGVTQVSIILPSLMLGIASIIVLYLLMTEWFRRNVAAITTGIAVSFPLFIFMAQDGTPLIYTIFLSLLLLLTGTYTSRSKHPRQLWKTLFLVVFALNLYAPLGIYLNLALLSTTLIHPHIRLLTRRLDRRWLSVGIGLCILLLVPLVYAVVQKPSIGLELLGFPTHSFSLSDNIKTVGATLFDPTAHTDNIYAPPVISIGMGLLLLLGLYRLIRYVYTARSYSVFIWLICLVPLVIINPERLPYLYPIIILLVGLAMSYLIRIWYRMFPLNPYARFVGLLPLGVIVLGLVYSSSLHYISAYYYDRWIVSQYSPDIRYLPHALKSVGATNDQKAIVVVSAAEQPFYELIARYRHDMSVSTDAKQAADSRLIVTRAAPNRASIGREPTDIITSRTTDNSDRFYTYKPADK